jgi:hypothetical protein
MVKTGNNTCTAQMLIKLRSTIKSNQETKPHEDAETGTTSMKETET